MIETQVSSIKPAMALRSGLIPDLRQTTTNATRPKTARIEKNDVATSSGSMVQMRHVEIRL